MPITLNGDTGITTPGLTNTGSTTLVSLTTTGNTILGDQSTDTLNVANGNLVLNSSGNLGIGTASPARRLQVNSGEAVAVRFTRGGGIVANNSLEWFDGTNGWYAGVSGSNFWGVAYNSSGAIDSAAIRLDSSGNLGLGVTPSAWGSRWRALQGGLNGGGSLRFDTQDFSTVIASNAFQNSSNQWIYTSTNGAARSEVNRLGFEWHTAPSGTAGNVITFTQAMTLNASGNAQIGTTTDAGRLTVSGKIRTLSGDIELDTGQVTTNSSANPLRLGVDGVEKARIESAGNFIIGGTNNNYGGKLTVDGDIIARGNKVIGITGTGVAAGTFAFRNSVGVQKSAVGSYYNIADEGNIEFINGTTTNAVLTSAGNLLVGATSFSSGGIARTVVSAGVLSAGFQIQLSGTVGAYIYGYTSGPTGFRVETTTTYPKIEMQAGGSGGVQLTSGATSWTSLSDERTKTDLVPITDAVQKVSSLRAVTGRFIKDEPETSRSFLIAQDFVEVFPQAVSTFKEKDDDTEYLGLAYTDTIPLLVAAIKELKSELDSVKTELAALKGN